MNPADLSRKLTVLASKIETAKNPSLSKVRIALEGILGESEGYAADTATILAHLIEWQKAKYRIDIVYRNFADRIRGPWRDGLAAHWYEHASDERQSAYDMSMRIIALGGDPIHTVIDIPVCPSDMTSFAGVLMELETAAIEKGHVAIHMAGENDSLRIFSENVVAVDTHHLDDLKRLMSDT